MTNDMREAFEKWWADFTSGDADGTARDGGFAHAGFRAGSTWARAALSAPAVEGWRPIESAPKNGADILLFCPQGDGSPGSMFRITEGHWESDPGGTTEYRDAEGRWVGQDDRDGFEGWITWDGGFSEDTMMPTHWMSLPAPPADAPQPPASPSVPGRTCRYCGMLEPQHAGDCGTFFADELAADCYPAPTTEAVSAEAPPSLQKAQGSRAHVSAEAVKVKPLDVEKIARKHLDLSDAPFEDYPHLQTMLEEAIKEALSAHPAPAQGRDEPVAWQWRFRAIGKTVGQWTEWRDGQKPDLRSTSYEVEERPLYLGPSDAYAKGWGDGREAAAQAVHLFVYGALDTAECDLIHRIEAAIRALTKEDGK